MTRMTRGELLLASRLMGAAADTFSNFGCNDMEQKMFEGIDKDELDRMVKDYETQANADCDEEDYCEFELRNIGDSGWMQYLAGRLLDESAMEQKP